MNQIEAVAKSWLNKTHTWLNHVASHGRRPRNRAGELRLKHGDTGRAGWQGLCAQGTGAQGEMAKAPRAGRATATERVSRPAEPPAPGAQHADTERLGGVRLQKAPGLGWGVGGWQDPQGPCLICPLSAPQAQTSWELGELARRESTWPQDRADRGSHTSGQLG